jgi:hypothetical protein
MDDDLTWNFKQITKDSIHLITKQFSAAHEYKELDLEQDLQIGLH